MSLKSFLFCIAICYSSASIFAATTADQYANNFARKGNTISFETKNGKYLIEACKEDLFRIRFRKAGSFESAEPWMVIKYQWDAVNMTVAETGTGFQIKTSKLQLQINKQPFQIKILDAAGKLLNADAGSNNQAPVQVNADTVSMHKVLQAGEHVFGFGERMDFLDQRAKQIQLNVGRGKGLPHIIGAYNILEANYSPIPFFMSTVGYGIFLHTSSATQWDMGASNPNTYAVKAVGEELDYYFMYGPDFPHLLDLYTSITGKSPLMPDFALGLQVGTYAGGTWGYEQMSSDAYVLALAKKLREMGVPVDILHIDSIWRIFGKIGGKGATSFEWRETFNNPKAMFDSLYAMNFKMVGLHVRPRFDNGNKLQLLDTARTLGYTYPENGQPGEFVNFFDSSAVNWWWKHGVKRIADLGAKFLKTDEGSAFGALANESDKVGPTGKEVTKLHNLFPIAYAKAAYEQFQQYNGIRGMNLTREGYAGVQRYPYLFAGDWPSEWQYFAPVIKAGLNIGISGVSNWAHCMGGFEHVADPELYVRWTQFGMLSPVAHLFGMDHPTYKEPWNYGPEAFAIFKKFDSLRYRLFPYLYQVSYQAHKTGMPMMRALVLQYQDDENVYGIADQYLLGNDLMVCPVTVKGAVTRSVYLPKGDWYDYWTGKLWKGQQYIHVLTPLDQVPLFVKAGSMIPMQPGMKFFGEKPVDKMHLQVYPGNGKGHLLYQDDGLSFDYQKGKSSTTDYEIASNSEETKILIKKITNDFSVKTFQYLATLHHAAVPKIVMVNGKKLLENNSSKDMPMNTGWNYDAVNQELHIHTGLNNQENQIQIQVQY
ncbi:MAG: alpha-glycosidase [Chitinophagaceae bacterium BSSC1]|nr:MAG: alpha-glycosidase [Chitinophagaceae bacterium BSSC1]